MARKELQTNVEVSPDEKRLESLSSSIASAENELAGIGEVKKRVLGEIEDGEKSLIKLNETRDSLDVEILSIKRERERHIKDLAIAKDDLVGVNVKKGEAEKSLADFKVSAEAEKSRLQNEVKSLEKKIETAKKDASRDLELSNDEKEKIKKEVLDLGNSLAILLKREEDQKEKNDTLISVCADLSRRKESLEADVQRNNTEISRQEESIKALEKDALELTQQISDKKLEVRDLDDSIDKKKLEYKAQETKLFAIKEKEVALDQRERFIRAQYERAGVKYEQ